MSKIKDAGAGIAGNVKGPPDRRRPESNPTNYWNKVEADLNSQSKTLKKSRGKK